MFDHQAAWFSGNCFGGVLAICLLCLERCFRGYCVKIYSNYKCITTLHLWRILLFVKTYFSTCLIV
jgi:hypothetical protein